MAYTKINKVIDGDDDQAKKAAGVAITTTGSVIMKNLKHPVRVDRAIQTARRVHGKVRGKQFLQAYSKNQKFRRSYNKQVVIPIVEALASVLAIGIPSIIAIKKQSGKAKKSRQTLTKMVQQGDIDPSDLFQYLRTASDYEKKIILSVLDDIGYDGSDVATFVGAYRKNRK